MVKYSSATVEEKWAAAVSRGRAVSCASGPAAEGK